MAHPAFPKSRFAVLAHTGRMEGDAPLYVVNEGADTLEDSRQSYLNAVATYGTTEVFLVERVPMLLFDGRSAQGRVVRLAERLAWCQQTMIAHGLTSADVAKQVRFGAPAIDEMFRGETIKADWVDQLVEALRRLVPAPSADDAD